jgi:hypothetical protein
VALQGEPASWAHLLLEGSLAVRHYQGLGQEQRGAVVDEADLDWFRYRCGARGSLISA